LDEQGQIIVTLLGEPDEYELVFERVADRVALGISSFPIIFAIGRKRRPFSLPPAHTLKFVFRFGEHYALYKANTLRTIWKQDGSERFPGKK
jgi:hypothetical protein